MSLSQDTDSQARHTLAELRRQLERSRTRARWQALFNALMLGLTSAAAVYLGLGLASLFWQAIAWTTWAWTGLIFALVVIVSVGRAWRKTPSQIDLARRADRQFGLMERLSTALELSHLSQAKPGILGAALWAEAEALAAQLQPEQLVPFTWPRRSWLVLVLVLAATGLELGSPLFRQTGGPGPAALADEVRLETLSRLQQTASLLHEEGEMQQDPYLQALAQAFHELAASLEGGGLAEAELELELARLMDHMGLAYGLENLADVATVEAGEQGGLDSRQPESSSEVRLEEDASELDGLLDQLAQVREDLQAAKESREASRGMVSFDDLSEMNPYARPSTFRAPEAVEDERLVSREALPLGPAQNSEAGAGDLAGEGTAALAAMGGQDTFETIETQKDELHLPLIALEGKQVKTEMSPKAQLTTLSDNVNPATLGWQTRQETELRHTLLLPADRLVVRRYFERDSAETR